MVTLKDIAKKTGFSTSVVSRAINPKPDQKVAPETKLRVEAAVKKLNYRRNYAASQLARGKSAAIGVFLPAYGYSLIADLVIGISEAAAEHDFQCNFYFGMDGRDYLRFINSVKDVGGSGILSYGFERSLHDVNIRNAVSEFLSEGGRILLLNSPEMPEMGIRSISIDNYAGGKLAAEHLLERGCEKFYCVSTTLSWQLEQRYCGFADTLKKANCDCQLKLIKNEGFHDYRDFDFEKLIGSFDANSPKCGIFSLNDYLALDAVRSMVKRNVLNLIGKNYFIVGHDNIPGGQYAAAALTTVEQSFRALGQCSFKLLFQRISGEKNSAELQKNILPPPPRLIIRETT